MSTHSTAARRRRVTVASKRSGKELSLPLFRSSVLAFLDGALRFGKSLRSASLSGDAIRRYLAESFTLVAAFVALAVREAQRAWAAFRPVAADMLSKTRSATGARREWVQRQLAYAGQAVTTWQARNGVGDAWGIHRMRAGRMPTVASWRLVLVECMTRIVRPDSPFEWEEYDWRNSLWGRRWRVWPGVLAGFGLLVVVLALAFFLASRATNSAQARLHPTQPTTGTSAPSGIIVAQPGGADVPSPTAALYEMGAWVSDNTPSGGTVKVFVRVSSQTKPVPNVPVTLSIDGGGPAYSLGPIKTDADGLAIFTVSSGGRGGAVFVTATAIVGGQTLTHQTTFFPQ